MTTKIVLFLTGLSLGLLLTELPARRYHRKIVSVAGFPAVVEIDRLTGVASWRLINQSKEKAQP